MKKPHTDLLRSHHIFNNPSIHPYLKLLIIKNIGKQKQHHQQPKQRIISKQMIKDAGFEKASYQNLSFGAAAIHTGCKA